MCPVLTPAWGGLSLQIVQDATVISVLMAVGALLFSEWGLYGSPSQPASKKGKKDNFHFLLTC